MHDVIELRLRTFRYGNLHKLLVRWVLPSGREPIRGLPLIYLPNLTIRHGSATPEKRFSLPFVQSEDEWPWPQGE